MRRIARRLFGSAAIHTMNIAFGTTSIGTTADGWPNFTRSKRVLDIGCGTGWLTRDIAEHHPIDVIVAFRYCFCRCLKAEQFTISLNYSHFN